MSELRTEAQRLSWNERCLTPHLWNERLTSQPTSNGLVSNWRINGCQDSLRGEHIHRSPSRGLAPPLAPRLTGRFFGQIFGQMLCMSFNLFLAFIHSSCTREVLFTPTRSSLVPFLVHAPNSPTTESTVQVQM